MDTLRPPTFEQLREVLYNRPANIVHFDGHGGYGAVMDTPAGNLYADPESQTNKYFRPGKIYRRKKVILRGPPRDKPCLLVWANFEPASGIEGTEIQPQLSVEDRDILTQPMKGLRPGRIKVLLTSRRAEAWLQAQSCYRLLLSGLIGEGLLEYCNANS